LVFDPFAGSNVTGATAEALGRRWLATEISESYIAGSTYRFEPEALVVAARQAKTQAAKCATHDGQMSLF
jgi:site-specific DNA-methyltransferase (cytosine-N4-specific)